MSYNNTNENEDDALALPSVFAATSFFFFLSHFYIILFLVILFVFCFFFFVSRYLISSSRLVISYNVFLSFFRVFSFCSRPSSYDYHDFADSFVYMICCYLCVDVIYYLLGLLIFLFISSYLSLSLYIYIYIYTIYVYIYIYIYMSRPSSSSPSPSSSCPPLRDKYLYTTTNKCLQCLIEIMYRVF